MIAQKTTKEIIEEYQSLTKYNHIRSIATGKSAQDKYLEQVWFQKDEIIKMINKLFVPDEYGFILKDDDDFRDIFKEILCPLVLDEPKTMATSGSSYTIIEEGAKTETESRVGSLPSVSAGDSNVWHKGFKEGWEAGRAELIEDAKPTKKGRVR